MSTEQPGRTSRSNTPGSPVGSTIAIVVTIVAVVLGFFILKQIRDDSDGGARPAQTTAAPTSEPVTTDSSTTTTEFQLTKTGTKVQVANASVQDGVARQLSMALTGEGFDLADPTNAVIKLDASKVLYDDSIPEAKLVAESVAIVMGGIAVEVAPIPPPTKEAVLPSGTGVLVLLGNDRAGKTLAQMNGETTSDTTPAVTTTT